MCVLSAIQGASAWSSCLLSALAMICAIACHGCFFRKTDLNTSSSHPFTELPRSSHAPTEVKGKVAPPGTPPNVFFFFSTNPQIWKFSKISKKKKKQLSNFSKHLIFVNFFWRYIFQFLSFFCKFFAPWPEGSLDWKIQKIKNFVVQNITQKNNCNLKL